MHKARNMLFIPHCNVHTVKAASLKKWYFPASEILAHLCVINHWVWSVECSLSEFVPLYYYWHLHFRNSVPRFHHLLCIFPCVFLRNPPSFSISFSPCADVVRPHLQRAAALPETCYSPSSAPISHPLSQTFHMSHACQGQKCCWSKCTMTHTHTHTYNPRAKAQNKHPHMPKRITYAHFISLQRQGTEKCSKSSVIFQSAS